MATNEYLDYAGLSRLKEKMDAAYGGGGGGGGSSSEPANSDTTFGTNTVVETDLDSGDVKTTTFLTDGSITEVTATSGGVVKSTKTITFDSTGGIHVRTT